MSNWAASPRGFAFMLSYSLGETDMPFSLFRKARLPLQFHNLTIIVLDNEVYGETGGQASHTASTADLVGVARACGIADARTLSTMAEIESFTAAMQDV